MYCILYLALVRTSVDLVRAKVYVMQGFWQWGLAQELLGKGSNVQDKELRALLSRIETYRGEESSKNEIYF